MIGVRATLMLLALTVCALFVSASAYAQSGRVFVTAALGMDFNPCTRTAPCRTIAHALTVAPAGGEVVILESGNYDPFTVTQAVTVEAEPGTLAAITVPGGATGITINANATDTILLRGLTLVGKTGKIGIQFNSGGVLRVEHCAVSGFRVGGINFTPAAGGELYVTHTTARDNGSGVNIAGPNSDHPVRAQLDNCRFERNAGVGLNVGDYAQAVTAKDCYATGNGTGVRAATTLFNSVAAVALENCVVAHNTTGLSASTVFQFFPALIAVSNSTITGNGLAVKPEGILGQIASRGNNTVVLNGSNGAFSSTFTPD